MGELGRLFPDDVDYLKKCNSVISNKVEGDQ
jgi:hypothetical protein